MYRIQEHLVAWLAFIAGVALGASYIGLWLWLNREGAAPAGPLSSLIQDTLPNAVTASWAIALGYYVLQRHLPDRDPAQFMPVSETFLRDAIRAELSAASAEVAALPLQRLETKLTGIHESLTQLTATGLAYDSASPDSLNLLRDQLTDLIDMLQDSGIALRGVRVFETIKDCRDDVEADFVASTHAALLLQIGRNEFARGEAGVFSPLMRSQPSSIVRCRVLRADLNSPLFSRDRARDRNSHFHEWDKAFKSVRKELNHLRDAYQQPIEVRTHSEPFLARLYVFDKSAYVNPYVRDRNNDSMAYTYRIDRDDSPVLYKMALNYFLSVWMRSDPKLAKGKATEQEVFRGWKTHDRLH